MIEVNTKQAETQLASILAEVETQGRSVKILAGEKVVAEIIPSGHGTSRAHADPHADEATLDASSVYKTVGESLKGL